MAVVRYLDVSGDARRRQRTVQVPEEKSKPRGENGGAWQPPPEPLPALFFRPFVPGFAISDIAGLRRRRRCGLQLHLIGVPVATGPGWNRIECRRLELTDESIAAAGQRLDKSRTLSPNRPEPRESC